VPDAYRDLVRRYWRTLISPSAYYSLGFLTIGGFIGGILFWGAFNTAMEFTNTERFCNLVRKMSQITQFLFISHNKITMEMAGQLVGITMPEQGVSKVVAVDIEEALRLTEEAAA